MRYPNQQLFSNVLQVLGLITAVTFGPFALAGTEEMESGLGETGPADEVAVVVLTGPEVYNAVCIACHAAPGIGGAPALGDSSAWAARIASGMDTLIDHALNGYSGKTGIMPKKGGRLDLSDEEIIMAVQYMVEQVTE